MRAVLVLILFSLSHPICAQENLQVAEKVAQEMVDQLCDRKKCQGVEPGLHLYEGSCSFDKSVDLSAVDIHFSILVKHLGSGDFRKREDAMRVLKEFMKEFPLIGLKQLRRAVRAEFGKDNTDHEIIWRLATMVPQTLKLSIKVTGALVAGKQIKFFWKVENIGRDEYEILSHAGYQNRIWSVDRHIYYEGLGGGANHFVSANRRNVLSVDKEFLGFSLKPGESFNPLDKELGMMHMGLWLPYSGKAGLYTLTFKVSLLLNSKQPVYSHWDWKRYFKDEVPNWFRTLYGLEAVIKLKKEFELDIKAYSR